MAFESFLKTQNAEVVALCDSNEERLKKSMMLDYIKIFLLF